MKYKIETINDMQLEQKQHERLIGSLAKTQTDRRNAVAELADIAKAHTIQGSIINTDKVFEDFLKPISNERKSALQEVRDRSMAKEGNEYRVICLNNRCKNEIIDGFFHCEGCRNIDAPCEVAGCKRTNKNNTIQNSRCTSHRDTILCEDTTCLNPILPSDI